MSYGQPIAPESIEAQKRMDIITAIQYEQTRRIMAPMPKSYGFGIFISSGPTPMDPAWMFKYSIIIHFWKWHKYFHIGRGKGNAVPMPASSRYERAVTGCETDYLARMKEEQAKRFPTKKV